MIYVIGMIPCKLVGAKRTCRCMQCGGDPVLARPQGTLQLTFSPGYGFLDPDSVQQVAISNVCKTIQQGDWR